MLASMLEVPNDEWVKNKKDLVRDKIVLHINRKLEPKGLIQYSFSHFDLETEVFFSKVIDRFIKPVPIIITLEKIIAGIIL